MIKALVALLGGLGGLAGVEPAKALEQRRENERLMEELQVLRSRLPELPAAHRRRKARTHERMDPTPGRRRNPPD